LGVRPHDLAADPAGQAADDYPADDTQSEHSTPFE
jgi:hypothetical protein